MNTQQLILSLHKIGAIKFGTFTLKSGVESPVYFDLRLMVSKPKILAAVADRLQALAEHNGVLFEGLGDGEDGIAAECDDDVNANDPSFEEIVEGMSDADEIEAIDPSASNGASSKTAKRLSAGSRFVSQVCGVPYTALPIATRMSIRLDMPMIIRRKEAKNYGTKNLLEGEWAKGERCLVVEDVVTSGSSVLETAKVLRDRGLRVEEAVVVLDRQQGGSQMLEKSGIKLYSLFTIKDVLKTLFVNGKISRAAVRKTFKFVTDNQFVPESPDAPTKKPRLSAVTKMEFADRITGSSKLTDSLFAIMDRKRTNLCVAADVAAPADVLRLARALGPHICILKTHVDVVEAESAEDLESFVKELQSLASKFDFLIFEDRKFADIGQTVKMQYGRGMYRIAEWAHIVNAHPLPGPGVVEGLKIVADEAIGAEDDSTRGCLLVAEMSSEGNLISKEYTRSAVEMAKKQGPFVCGFVAQSRFDDEHPEWVFMTPGVHLESKGDAVGQKYDSPESAVVGKGADVVIVGRGITKAQDVVAAAKAYQKAAWEAYRLRVETV